MDGVPFLEIPHCLKIQFLSVWCSKQPWLCGSLVQFHHLHRLSSEVIATDSTRRYHGQNLEMSTPPVLIQVAKLHGKRSANFQGFFVSSRFRTVKLISTYIFFFWKLAGVLIFSAIPFTAVKAIANSPLGESLQSRMEENKKAAVKNSSKFKALAEKAKNER